ncbi:hypothetical protein N9B39_01910 [bacterium]|nr:hypothetical protein [bacterium]MDB4533054.1 hypothetical protein [bacterium]
MPQSTSGDPQVIQIGTKFTNEYAFEARGYLSAASKPLPMSLVGSGDVAKVASAGFAMTDGLEAGAIADSTDPTWANVSLNHDKGVGKYDFSSEIIEDGMDLLDNNLAIVADALASFKDLKLRASWQAGLSGSTVATEAALTLSNVLDAAKLIPSRRVLPSVLGSMKLYLSLKEIEFASGIDTGLMNVGGLPFGVIENPADDTSGDLVCFIGHPDLACGFTQMPDNVRLLSEATSTGNAVNGLSTLIASCRFAHAVIDSRWLRKIEIA